MEILTSKLQSLELNIINSKVQCLKREISYTMKKLYFYQIEKSELTLKKINYKLKISQNLVKLSRHINNNSSSHLHYLNKNIDMCFRILRNKVYTGFNNNLLYKLNTLQKLIYYKKDVMYTKIRGTVVYRERKERLGRKIGLILKGLSEKIIKDSEKCIELSTAENKESSEHRSKSIHEEISSEGFCSVNIYGQSSFDFNIGEATCTVNKFKNNQTTEDDTRRQIKHDLKEGKCSVENFVNLNNKKWKDFCCDVNKKAGIENKENQNWNNKTCTIKTEKDQNWNNKTCTVETECERQLKNINNLQNKACTVKKDQNWNHKACTVKKDQNWNQKTCTVKEDQNWNHKTCTVKEDQNWNHKTCTVKEDQNWNHKTCTVKKEETKLSEISILNTKISSTLANLNKKIIAKLYISLKDLYVDIVKLQILLTLKQAQYFIKGRLKSNYKNGSKISYILQKGDLESDKRFLHMIDDTLKDIEKYKDPIVVRMGIQFMLAKRYVEDIIYLKNE